MIVGDHGQLLGHRLAADHVFDEVVGFRFMDGVADMNTFVNFFLGQSARRPVGVKDNGDRCGFFPEPAVKQTQ